MADFAPAYEALIHDEGGYVLSNKKSDRGGLTYAGISRVMNPQWPGWACVDRNETPPADLVRSFYRDGYWSPLQGDAITDQRVASSIINVAVNTSAPGRPTVAVRLAQAAAKAVPDGQFGPATLAAINGMDPELFLARLALAKVARYAAICNHDRRQSPNLLGWLNRSLEGV